MYWVDYTKNKVPEGLSRDEIYLMQILWQQEKNQNDKKG